jgi:hypothetical protein
MPLMRHPTSGIFPIEALKSRRGQELLLLKLIFGRGGF